MLDRIILALVVIGIGCSQQPEILDIVTEPIAVAADKKFAGVYSGLDGSWEGVFQVFESRKGQESGKTQPRDVSRATLDTLDLQISLTIRVRQTYESRGPYFQTVLIEDTYEDGPTNRRVVRSRGVNKVQNGQMWCIVKKPDEVIVHHGRTEGEATIIWERNETGPQKIEFFRETVRDSLYEIVGWGYYADDNPNLAPRFWFLGTYRRK